MNCARAPGAFALCLNQCAIGKGDQGSSEGDVSRVSAEGVRADQAAKLVRVHGTRGVNEIAGVERSRDANGLGGIDHDAAPAAARTCQRAGENLAPATDVERTRGDHDAARISRRVDLPRIRYRRARVGDNSARREDESHERRRLRLQALAFDADSPRVLDDDLPGVSRADRARFDLASILQQDVTRMNANGRAVTRPRGISLNAGEPV